MQIITGNNNVDTMLRMYRAVLSGLERTARGATTRNISNMAVVLNTYEPVLTSFKARKLNLEYAKREWLWYLGADPMDSSIEAYATMWAKLKQSDGSYYSNYGQYIFGPEPSKSQFAYVLKTLRDDPSSRRACMTLLKREHLFAENSDVVCTYAINFEIINGTLSMTVMMRSNDVVFGFTNDAFCFSQLHEFMYQMLLKTYPNLQRGTYVHFTNSMHVYERHYEMLQAILLAFNGDYVKIDVPRPSPDEVNELVMKKGQKSFGTYSRWLYEESDAKTNDPSVLPSSSKATGN